MAYKRVVVDEWKCDAEGCLAIHSKGHMLKLGVRPLEVESLPVGWWALTFSQEETKHYCPRHTVVNIPPGEN
jgi:hypothetical protein